MRPFATIGAFQRAIVRSCALVKIGSPVSAFTPWSRLSPSATASCAPATQIIDSRPPPVVVAMGEPLPVTLAHQAVATEGGDPPLMRSATRPLALGEQDVPLPANASTVPEGVPITAPVGITAPAAATGKTNPHPMP